MKCCWRRYSVDLHRWSERWKNYCTRNDRSFSIFGLLGKKKLSRFFRNVLRPAHIAATELNWIEIVIETPFSTVDGIWTGAGLQSERKTQTPTTSKHWIELEDRRAYYCSALIMAALRYTRCRHYIFVLWFLSFFFFYFFSSPNLSRRRLDVYHTSIHGVALVWI